MKVIKIDKTLWPKGLEKLRGTFRLFGPLKAQQSSDFRELAAGQLPEMGLLNTRLSPKGLVFPQSENMMDYSLDEKTADHHILKDSPKDYTPRAVIGIRPCDAKAMALVKMNFDTEQYKDPYWLNLYNATTFVGLGCASPCSTCFCTTAGCGPYHEEGLDILLVEQPDGYLAKVLSDKGSRLMSAAGWDNAVDDAGAIENLKKDAEARIVSKVPTEALRGADTLTLHGASFWEEFAFSCINCGTCTFVCPTCWCFDIQDEVHGLNGVRMRNWDSCMFPLFTIHTTGHNPRGTKVQRLRQRFMHKLKYFVDKYESGIMCVGCGRCVRQCPVNIDIRKVCEAMNALASGNACPVQRS